MNDIRTWAASHIWKAKLDLSKAFYALPMHENSIPYLATRIGGICYAYTRLPIGLQLSPGIFEETLSEICHHYTQMGWMKHYLDDIVVVGDTKEQVLWRTNIIETLLTESGFKVNSNKKEVGQSIIMGGVHIGGHHGKLPDTLIEECTTCMENLKRIPGWTHNHVQKLTGILNYIGTYLKNKPKEWYMWMRMASKIPLGQTPFPPPIWGRKWLDTISQWLTNNRKLCHASTALTIQVDSCKGGWGAVTLIGGQLDQTIGGVLKTITGGATLIETRGAIKAMRRLKDIIPNKTWTSITIESDNQGLVAALKKGTSKEHIINDKIKEIWKILKTAQCEVYIKYIRGNEIFADAPSRREQLTNEEAHNKAEQALTSQQKSRIVKAWNRIWDFHNDLNMMPNISIA
eukprot:GHVL01040007.1.p1 GENE.GHVL01040007.1~~GHVL01040007.1.p1  ORF type:complete len:402 (-),score=29.67 GHVL01040007.1:173-1378(-)